MTTELPESPQSYEAERERAIVIATGRLHYMLPTIEEGKCYGCSGHFESIDKNNFSLCDTLLRSRGECSGTETVFVRASDIDRYRIEAVTRKLKS